MFELRYIAGHFQRMAAARGTEDTMDGKIREQGKMNYRDLSRRDAMMVCKILNYLNYHDDERKWR